MLLMAGPINRRDRALSVAQETIRKLRREKGYSQHELDDYAEVPHGRTSSYEQGKAQPSLEYMEKIALLFGLKSAYDIKNGEALNQRFTSSISYVEGESSLSLNEQAMFNVPSMLTDISGTMDRIKSLTQKLPVQTFVVEVSGDNYAPRLPHGSRVEIRPLDSFSVPKSGLISLAIHSEGHAEFKRPRFRDGAWVLEEIADSGTSEPLGDWKVVGIAVSILESDQRGLK